VKDNNNLLTHNQWSAGEYTKNISELTCFTGFDVMVTNEYSIIGEHSFKCERINENNHWAQSTVLGEYTNVQGKSIIYTPLGRSSLYIVFYYSDGSFSTGGVTVSRSDEPQLITLNLQSDPDKEVTSVALRILIYAINQPCYWDDLSLISL